MFSSFSGVISQGWQFIRSSVSSGVENLSSIAGNIGEAFGIDYEDVIRGQDIASIAQETWNKLNELPSFYKVTEKHALGTPFDYREKYIMNMKVHAYDKNSGDYVDQWITVESNNLMTKSEWFNLAREATHDTPFGTDLVLEYATEFEFYAREQGT